MGAATGAHLCVLNGCLIGENAGQNGGEHHEAGEAAGHDEHRHHHQDDRPERHRVEARFSAGRRADRQRENAVRGVRLHAGAQAKRRSCEEFRGKSKKKTLMMERVKRTMRYTSRTLK